VDETPGPDTGSLFPRLVPATILRSAEGRPT
jgi:hypothetical protein